MTTDILSSSEFHNAEEYHLDYYGKNPSHYKSCRKASGREVYLKKMWGVEKVKQEISGFKAYKKMSKEEILSKLMPVQYRVTQDNGTEPPFDNPCWNDIKEGIYVDVVSGEPLF